MNNPYQPPRADLDTASQTSEGRPVLVWIIFIWSMFTVFSALLGSLLIFSGWLPLPDITKAYYAATPWWKHVLTAAFIGWYALSAALLFRMRRLALPFFAAHCLWTIIGISINYSDPAYRKLVAESGGSPLSAFVGLGIAVLILVYVFWLHRKNRLS